VKRFHFCGTFNEPDSKAGAHGQGGFAQFPDGESTGMWMSLGRGRKGVSLSHIIRAFLIRHRFPSCSICSALSSYIYVYIYTLYCCCGSSWALALWKIIQNFLLSATRALNNYEAIREVEGNRPKEKGKRKREKVGSSQEVGK